MNLSDQYLLLYAQRWWWIQAGRRRIWCTENDTSNLDLLPILDEHRAKYAVLYEYSVLGTYGPLQ